MHCFCNDMKQSFLRCFNRKPLNRRIAGILCWTLGLILTALLLSGKYMLAFGLIILSVSAYLALVFACRKIVDDIVRRRESKEHHSMDETE